MGVDIKWEGLDKLQDNLEKAATLDDIKRVVRHQEKTLLETAQEHAVKKSAGGEFYGGYSGIERSQGGIYDDLKTDLLISTKEKSGIYVTSAPTHLMNTPSQFTTKKFLQR